MLVNRWNGDRWPADFTQNIADSLSREIGHYPLEQIFIVSSKSMLLGEKMQKFVNRTGRKPELEDADHYAKELAWEWTTYAALGFDLEEKREYYTELSWSASYICATGWWPSQP